MEENQDLDIKLQEKMATKGLELKFILVHKPKYCDSHSICKGNNPDQAANVADWWWSR